mmetsp:Transcript_29960/g.65540  ORF Transcript_29960/g.65540 Transcript_29960/m.65540 type:complete len:205 (+) Transcript_29960:795-1409(+)
MRGGAQLVGQRRRRCGWRGGRRRRRRRVVPQCGEEGGAGGGGGGGAAGAQVARTARAHVREARRARGVCESETLPLAVARGIGGDSSSASRGSGDYRCCHGSRGQRRRRRWRQWRRREGRVVPGRLVHRKTDDRLLAAALTNVARACGLVHCEACFARVVRGLSATFTKEIGGPAVVLMRERRRAECVMAEEREGQRRWWRRRR